MQQAKANISARIWSARLPDDTSHRTTGHPQNCLWHADADQHHPVCGDGMVDDHFIAPILHFKYFGFERWSHGPVAMYVIHALMILACLGMIMGLLYRYSALFALLFTYCELIDITYYLNHYYFVSLMSSDGTGSRPSQHL